MVEQKNYDQKYFKVSPLENKPQGILFDFCVASINMWIFLQCIQFAFINFAFLFMLAYVILIFKVLRTKT